MQVANHLVESAHDEAARRQAAAGVLVTVVLVHRNRPAFLAHALASLEAQDHPKLEVIIMPRGEYDRMNNPRMRTPAGFRLYHWSCRAQPPAGRLSKQCSILGGLHLHIAVSTSGATSHSPPCPCSVTVVQNRHPEDLNSSRHDDCCCTGDCC